MKKFIERTQQIESILGKKTQKLKPSFKQNYCSAPRSVISCYILKIFYKFNKRVLMEFC